MENWWKQESKVFESVNLNGGKNIPTDFFRYYLFKSMMERRNNESEGDNPVLLSLSLDGYGDFEEIHKALTKEEKTLLIQREDKGEGSNSLYWWKSEDTFVHMNEYDETISLSIEGIHQEKHDSLVKLLTPMLNKIPPQGQVTMLAREGDSLYLTSIGAVSCPFQRMNYTDQQLKVYDSLLDDLKSSSPQGRLTILDGEPGTGKSFFIRGIINAADASFVFIPASLGGSLTGPEITPILLRDKIREVPMVLIMEDADAVFTKRHMENMSRLSELLNMSDGILGDLADIRIIATTNSTRVEMDDAILRPGRLAHHLTFEKLEFKGVKQIFEHLTGKPWRSSMPNVKHSLAEIYKLARDNGWIPEVTKKKKRQRHRMPSIFDEY